jgi:hypothetical protein
MEYVYLILQSKSILTAVTRRAQEMVLKERLMRQYELTATPLPSPLFLTEQLVGSKAWHWLKKTAQAYFQEPSVLSANLENRHLVRNGFNVHARLGSFIAFND